MRSTKRFMKPKPAMDGADRTVNMMFLISNCVAAYVCQRREHYVWFVIFALLALWFLKNELLYGRG